MYQLPTELIELILSFFSLKVCVRVTTNEYYFELASKRSQELAYSNFTTLLLRNTEDVPKQFSNRLEAIKFFDSKARLHPHLLHLALRADFATLEEGQNPINFILKCPNLTVLDIRYDYQKVRCPWSTLVGADWPHLRSLTLVSRNQPSKKRQVFPYPTLFVSMGRSDWESFPSLTELILESYNHGVMAADVFSGLVEHLGTKLQTLSLALDKWERLKELTSLKHLAVATTYPVEPFLDENNLPASMDRMRAVAPPGIGIQMEICRLYSRGVYLFDNFLSKVLHNPENQADNLRLLARSGFDFTWPHRAATSQFDTFISTSMSHHTYRLVWEVRAILDALLPLPGVPRLLNSSPGKSVFYQAMLITAYPAWADFAAWIFGRPWDEARKHWTAQELIAPPSTQPILVMLIRKIPAEDWEVRRKFMEDHPLIFGDIDYSATNSIGENLFHRCTLSESLGKLWALDVDWKVVSSRGLNALETFARQCFSKCVLDILLHISDDEFKLAVTKKVLGGLHPQAHARPNLYKVLDRMKRLIPVQVVDEWVVHAIQTQLMFATNELLDELIGHAEWHPHIAKALTQPYDASLRDFYKMRRSFYIRRHLPWPHMLSYAGAANYPKLAALLQAHLGDKFMIWYSVRDASTGLDCVAFCNKYSGRGVETQLEKWFGRPMKGSLSFSTTSKPTR